jgi:hypothetical protein
MRTSNFFSIAALVICGMVCVNSVKADGTPTNSDQVTVNLKFKPVQSISVNTTQKEVNFVYESEKDYLNGVTSVIHAKHLKVFSTGGFEVKVKASDKNFTSGNTKLTIPVEHVSVTATASAGNPIEEYTFESQALDNVEKIIIQSSKGGTELEFDVEYDNTGDSKGAYINGYNSQHVADGATVFTTIVTYSIVTI